MKLLLISFLLCFSGLSIGQSQEEVSKALDKMKSSGMFTGDQIEAARKQLMGMDSKRYNALLNAAKKKSQDPEIQKKAMEVYQKQKAKSTN